MNVLKNIIEHFKNRKENELEKQKRLDNTRDKQYFLDSNVYGKIFK